MDQATYRQTRSLLEPCQTADELDAYLRTWLKLDLPWDTVDEDSTSAPLKLVWGVYKVLLTGQGPTKHVVAASRNSAKTVCASLIQFFSLLHFRRDGAHIAAILDQSMTAIRYLDTYMNIPELWPYRKIDNVRIKQFISLPANDFTPRSEATLRVVTATKKGANSPRASCFAGKTSVLLYRQNRWTTGRFSELPLDGIYRRFNRGEELVAATVNPVTGEIEPSKIIAVSRTLRTDRIVLESDGKFIECTGDHWLASGYDDGGLLYRQALSFGIGDALIRRNKATLGKSFINVERPKSVSSEYQEFNPNFKPESVLVGLMLGDGCVARKRSPSGFIGNARFQMTKSGKAREYCRWVVDRLSVFGEGRLDESANVSGYTNKPLDRVSFKASQGWTELHNKWYRPDNKKKIPEDLDLDWEALAVWFMDDGSKSGTLSTYCFSEPEHEFLIKKINELVGFDCASLQKTSKGLTIALRWPIEHKDKYFKLMNLMHPDYQYKRHKGRACSVCERRFFLPTNVKVCNSPECHFWTHQKIIKQAPIKAISSRIANEKARERWVYDIKVEKNHNFFANGFLVHNCLTLDEVDLTPPEVISEVAYVADPERTHKFDPVFVYLSSRKTNDGPIQKLQDQAIDQKRNANKRIKLHKWSQADFMELCLPVVHKPESGQHHAFIHTESLETVWGKEQFDQGIPESIKPQYKEVVAYEGCKTCPAFLACQGRSAKQRGDSPMLRTRQFVGDILEAVGDPQVIIAQSLNWKPESTAIVFKTFSPHRHIKTPTDYYEWAIGERFNPDGLDPRELDRIEEEGTFAEIARITPTKTQIYNAMRQAGWTIFAGVDWGYNPDPAVIVIAGYHKKWKRLAVLHTANALNHANHVWAQHIGEQIYPHLPFEWVGPDMADPASPTYFAKYKIRSLDTKPPRIETGVSFIRGLLWNPVNQTSNFAVLDDSMDYPGKQELGREQGNWMLISAMQRWTHKRMATGDWDMTKFEDNKWTHPIDALRYGLDPVIEEVRIGIAARTGPPEIRIEDRAAKKDPEALKIIEQKNELKTQMNQHFSEKFGIDNVFRDEQKMVAAPPDRPKPKGSVKFKFGQ